MRRTTTSFYYNAYASGTEWDTNPENMVDGNEATYAETITASLGTDYQMCTTSTASSTSVGASKIEKVEVRILRRNSGAGLFLRPYFNSGADVGDGHNTGTSGSKAWSAWQDVTSDTNAPASWRWSDVKAMYCLVYVVGALVILTHYAWKVEVRVTYILLSKKKKNKQEVVQDEKEDSMVRTRDYDIPYGVSSVAITATGVTVVATTGGYYHGFTLIANTVDAQVYVYDNASTASGNILDARVVLSGLSDESDKINPIRAKNGIVISVTGTAAVGALFYSPKG